MKKFNSIIINYDESSKNLFNWYQQLIAESLGKKGKGLLPIVSNMPKDNHSLMQLFIDGPKNNRDKETLEEIKLLIDKFSTFEFHISEINKGLKNSIYQGIDKIAGNFDYFLVFEELRR